jgi:membrane-associated phospholipid phosphatase
MRGVSASEPHSREEDQPCQSGGVVRLARVRPAGWWPDVLLLAGFVALTVALARGALLGWDLAVRSFVDGHRPAVLYWPAWVGNYLGQGGWLTGGCGLLALYLAWRRRSLWPLGLVVAAFILTFGTLTPLKDWAERAAPHTFELAHPERFGSGGVSYPSGHLVNAIVWYGVLALLLTPWLPERARLALRVVPPAVLCLTTVYLGYHWLTDTVAGLLLGLLLDRLLHRVPWRVAPAARSAPGTPAAGRAATGTAGARPDQR